MRGGIFLFILFMLVSTPAIAADDTGLSADRVSSPKQISWDFYESRVHRSGKAGFHCRNAPIAGHMVNGLPVLRAALDLRDNGAILTGCTLTSSADAEFEVTNPNGALIEFGCRLQGEFDKTSLHGIAWAEGVFSLNSAWMKYGPWRCTKNAEQPRGDQPENMQISFSKNNTTVGCIPQGSYKATAQMISRAGFRGGKNTPGEVSIDLASTSDYGFTVILVFLGECQYQSEPPKTLD